ncbi:hypothetical protein GCM10010399_08670 [Dactylosporangium fulvum]|uniref:citrate synthase (unknown stereospecificity) n=1 Tax=Dactylosporangium fulvum TaxID=53359 RepID=A0ABY5WD45_9ACTN|nr:citrate/2-methylcitrate synthase [Dactylosporangium fulvum]UWP87489.1 AMP-binding protein [Dactylosporangium fulvum]
MTTGLVPALGSGFCRFAETAADRPALVLSQRVLSYGECNDTARRWASLLWDAAGDRPRRIGVLGYRSEISYLGVLTGVLLGAAFVPLNPNFPQRRTRAMLESADIDALIVDDAAAGQLPELLDGLRRPPVVLVPGAVAPAAVDGRALTAADVAGAGLLSTIPGSAPDDLAYLLFTSGSTGTPKGVPITVGNLSAFLGYVQERYAIQPFDRLSQTFEQTFDLSVFDLLMAWENGAALCAMKPIDLVSPFGYLDRNNVTVWFSVPSVAALLRKRGTLLPGSLPTLRWSLFCGEPLPRGTAEAWQAAAPNSVVENLYGPTEATIACAVHRWDPAVSPGLCVHDTVPIGQFFPGMEPLVVDRSLRPVQDGAAGELCLAGPQVTSGYWRAHELTDVSFFEHGGLRYYRTGDLVRANGCDYAYLGRGDHQVKVGGHRIELGEVEAVLRQAGAVEAVCLVWPDQHTLTAVVSGGSATTPQLIHEAARQLPPYMTPWVVRRIAQMPLNSSGKIDRGKLRDWLGDSGGQGRDGRRFGAAVVRVDSVEELVACTLRVPREQVTDGLSYQSIQEWDSLGHVALMVALEETYGRAVSPECMTALHSIAAIKEFVGEGLDSAAQPLTQPLTQPAAVHRGLDGIVVDRSEITNVDGAAGVLEYRGYSIHDLVEHASYEDVAHLLIAGDLPGPDARRQLHTELAAGRRLPPAVLELLRSLRSVHPMDALLAAVPAVQAFDGEYGARTDESYDDARTAGVRLIGAIPMLVAAHHAFRSGREFVPPPERLGHVDAFLTALTGTTPADATVRFVTRGLVIHADHSSNASTFAARVVTGCRSGIHNAVTAAIAAAGGPLHGGAAERVMRLIDEIGVPENARDYVERTRRRGEPVMGFGHRVYRTEDPRVRYLRSIVVDLSHQRGDDRELQVLDAVAAAMARYRRHGLAPNVDLYAGLGYRLMDLPEDLTVPMFVIGRAAGWVAHVLEQHRNNVLIRPLMEYAGPQGRSVLQDPGRV